MGGGAGASLHGRFRIVTEKTVCWTPWSGLFVYYLTHASVLNSW